MKHLSNIARALTNTTQYQPGARSGKTTGTCTAKGVSMLNPAVIESHPTPAVDNFWVRILTDEELGQCDDLQKLLVGCEIIAALDAVELLAA